MLVGVKDGKAISIKGDPNNHNQGLLCLKGAMLILVLMRPQKGAAEEPDAGYPFFLTIMRVIDMGFIPSPTNACVGCGVCSYLCPQALLLMLFARLGRHSKTPISVMQIKWESEKCNCKGRTPCAEICSLSLNPRTLGKKEAEKNACINCGDCVKECAKVKPSLKEKALNLGFYP